MTLEDVRSVLLSILVGQGFFACACLFFIWQQLKKQTVLSKEARDFVKNRGKAEEIMHGGSKVTYDY